MIKAQPFCTKVRVLTGVLFLFFQSIYFPLYSQIESKYGALPFIQFYTPKDYQAGVVNLSVRKDKKGILYFANTQGIVQFDGNTWRTIEVPNVEFVRTLDIGDTDSIFIGAVNQIGKLVPNKTGKLEFVSLVDLIQEESRNFGEVWKVKATPKGIFFVTDKYLFRYKNGKITQWRTKGKAFYSAYYLNNTLFVLDKGFGLEKVVGDKLELVSNDEPIANGSIRFLFPYQDANGSYSDNEIVVGDRTASSLLILNLTTKQLRAFKTELTEKEVGSIYNATQDKNGNYYVATLHFGIICLDVKGKKLFQISQQEGLADKVYDVELDEQQNTWVALSKGIAKLETGSPFKKIGEHQGLSGIVTDAISFQDRFYISSTNSIFYFDDIENNFSFLQGDRHQIWFMKKLVINKDTICLAASNEGIEKINNMTLQTLEETESSINHIVQSTQNSNTVYVGLSNQKGIYRLDFLPNNKRIFQKAVRNQTVLNLEMINDLLFTTDENNKIRIYQQKDTLEELQLEFNATVKNIEKHNEQIYMATDSLVYIWKNSSLEIEPHITRLIGKDESFVEMYSIDKQHLILRVGGIDKTSYYLFNTETNTSELLPTERLTNNSVSIHTFINTGSNIEATGSVAIGTSEGLFYLDLNNKNYKNTTFNVFIRRVMLADSVLFYENYTSNNQQPKLTHKQNSLTFFYSANNSSDTENTLFRYRLNGYDTKWSEWTNETKKEYTNLNAGKYSFEVEAKNVYDTKGQIAKYDFIISSPFYKTPLAYILYIIFGALLVSVLTYAGVKYNVRRLKHKNQKLEEIVRERTTELRLTNSELEQQKEEVLMQKKNIEEQKEELEKSYKNIQTLADIGQQITATLDLSELISTLYANVNSLMPAEGFGIGVYNSMRQQIDFRGFIENGETLPFNADSLEDNDKLAVQSFKQQKEIFTNNFEKDFPQYQNHEVEVGGESQSLIYLPLVIQEKAIGVLTVQSFSKEAYQKNHLTILRSLASYAAIAVSNAQSYATINEKNQHITDSIRYAHSIQAAILPSKEDVRKNIGDFFILYRPKDIVSGDFYWFGTVSKQMIIAVIDCTGHGVPGAFMSLIGNTFLHEIINEKNITDPAQILEHLDKLLKESLQTGEQTNRDGMDTAICVLEKNQDNSQTKLRFAGAKRPLWYALPNTRKLKSVAGTRRSIGSKRIEGKPYQNHELILEKGTQVYLTTDGFVDQSNTRGKKFGTPQLIELIENNLSLSIYEQEDKIEKALDIHQGTVEQRDDITLLGFEL